MSALTETVLARLKAGEQLHMQLTAAGRKWWLEQPRLDVPDNVIMSIVQFPDSPIREAGDSLFGLPLNSQTWTNAGDSAEPQKTRERDIRHIKLDVDGHLFNFVTDCGGRDPYELTLGEWMSAPALTAAMLWARLLDERRSQRTK